MTDLSVRRKTAVTAIGAYVLHPKKHNLSFGRWAIPVMAQKMQSGEVNERRRAVQSLCDFVFDSRRVASKEFNGIAPILKDLCDDSDPGLRLNVSKCLAAITATAAGRRAFDQHGFYSEALDMLTDESEEVRRAANVALRRLVISPVASNGLVESGAIPKLIERISKETDGINEVLLDTLHVCCLVDRDKALECEALEKVIPQLESASPAIRARAATLIKDLTVDANGRNRFLHLSAVSPLLDLCSDPDEMVRAKSLAALMMIANATPGRFLALEEKAIEKILPLIRSENPEIRLNAIKVLTALSEAPPGRRLLMEYFNQILVPLNDNIQEIRRAAKVLNAVVTFKP